jgi:hypothetical protein
MDTIPGGDIPQANIPVIRTARKAMSPITERNLFEGRRMTFKSLEASACGNIPEANTVFAARTG